MRPFTTRGTDSIVLLPAGSPSSVSRKVQAGASLETLCTSICFNGENLCACLSWPGFGQSVCACPRRRKATTAATAATRKREAGTVDRGWAMTLSAGRSCRRRPNCSDPVPGQFFHCLHGRAFLLLRSLGAKERAVQKITRTSSPSITSGNSRFTHLARLAR
jgi:hypothetical protein